MGKKRSTLYGLLIFSGLCLLPMGRISAQMPPMSRDMQLGIFYFNHREDSQAMDRFVEVLNHGAPAERASANQYLNQITQRMTDTGSSVSSSSASVSKQVPAQSKPQDLNTKSEPQLSDSSASDQVGKKPSVRIKNAVSIRAQIQEKIRNMIRAGLRKLHSFPHVTVVSQKDGNPWAIAIPSDDFFRSKVAFRAQAQRIMKALSLTIYGEGKAKILIFPAGAVLGDVKVVDMRRAVAIADALVASGIAPSRIQAELLTGGSALVPRQLLLFKGIIFIFEYNESLDLKAPPDEEGPPLSLGVSAPSFRVDRGEGDLIEFSAEDPKSGIQFWKFKIIKDGKEGAGVINEVVGSGPVFHQLYWNARKKYSGPHLPYGSYECLLTAEDGDGRMRAIHRWITVTGTAEPIAVTPVKAPLKTSLSKSKKSVKPDLNSQKNLLSPPPAIEKSLAGAERVTYVQISPKKNNKKSLRKSRVKKRKSTSANSDLLFTLNTYQLTSASKKKLLQTARLMAKDLRARYEITGYAKPSEKNAKSLARLRAQVVAGLLINKYGISIKRLSVKSFLAASGKPRVAIKKRGNIHPWKKKS